MLFRRNQSKTARAPQNGADWPLVAALCLLFFLQGMFASRLKSPTSDEPAHIAAGASYIANRSIVANPQHPPLIKELAGLSLALAGIRWPSNLAGEELQKLSAGWEWAAGNRFLAEAGVGRAISRARLPLLLLSPFLGILIYWWGRELAGSGAGLCALYLFAIDPTMVAHSYLVTTDVGVTLFGMLFLLTLFLYLRQPGTVRLAAAGVALGLALGAKFSAVLWLPIAAALMGAACVWPANSGGEKTTPERTLLARLATAGLALAGMCAIAAIVIQVLYFSPRGPILYLYGLGQVNADHLANVPTYLAGHLQHRFASYFAVAWLVKEPLATIALAVGGTLLVLRSRSIPRLAKLFLLVPPAVFLAACTLWADDIGIRYAIPTLPFGYLAGGIALAALFQGRGWPRTVAAVACGWLAVAAAGIYPDHLSYFNEAACLPGQPEHIGWDGGSRCGPEWLADSNVDWGQGLPQLKAWLDRNAPAKTIRLEYFGSYPPEGYGIGFEPARKYPLVAPPPGLYAISSHIVAVGPAQGDFGWLREEPLAIVGHAYYIFEF